MTTARSMKRPTTPRGPVALQKYQPCKITRIRTRLREKRPSRSVWVPASSAPTARTRRAPTRARLASRTTTRCASPGGLRTSGPRDLSTRTGRTISGRVRGMTRANYQAEGLSARSGTKQTGRREHAVIRVGSRARPIQGRIMTGNMSRYRR